MKYSGDTYDAPRSCMKQIVSNTAFGNENDASKYDYVPVGHVIPTDAGAPVARIECSHTPDLLPTWCSLKRLMIHYDAKEVPQAPRRIRTQPQRVKSVLKSSVSLDFCATRGATIARISK